MVAVGQLLSSYLATGAMLAMAVPGLGSQLAIALHLGWPEEQVVSMCWWLAERRLIAH